MVESQRKQIGVEKCMDIDKYATSSSLDTPLLRDVLFVKIYNIVG